MKKIPLTWGCEALVDDCDFESLNKHSWYWTSSNMKYGYAVTGHKAVGMHNMILPPPTGMEVDHINGNGLDNQRHNLRHVTRAQQCMNRQRGSKKKGTSKYKGVRFWNNNKKWHARIGVNGRKIHLGYFRGRSQSLQRSSCKVFWGVCLFKRDLWY